MNSQEFVEWSTKDGVVSFHGTDYLIVKRFGDADGAMATQEQYESFSLNYAHAYAHGPIMRFGTLIGNIRDLIASRASAKAE